MSTFLPKTALLLVAASLIGCAASARNYPAMPLPHDFTLQPGERAALPERASLHYLGVSHDSRCPPGAQCIQAGDATVRFQFYDGKHARSDVELNTAKATTQPIGRWYLHLLQLEHGTAPAVTVRVDERP